MKTLTELSGTLVRMAAKAIEEARSSFPLETSGADARAANDVASPVGEPVSAAAGGEEPQAGPVAGQGGEAGEAAPAPAQEAVGSGAAAADDAAGAPSAHDGESGGASPPPVTEPGAGGESEAAKAAFDVAVTSATGLTGDRLMHLRGAVVAAEGRVADVRLVRVFGPEEPISGAHTVGGFQYLVDYAPRSMRQDISAPKKERGGRGGGKGGPRGGGAGAGGGGAKASATGGFSMDSLREDRKGQRGGRPGGGGAGGGRRPGGGGGAGGPGGASGRPGGGRPPSSGTK